MSKRDDVNRSNLPIPDIQHPGLITYDAKDPDTRFPPIRDVRPPQGSPNVQVILIDDVGCGASSMFGGPCQTPNFEKLAKGELKYTRFHTTRHVRARRMIRWLEPLRQRRKSQVRLQRARHQVVRSRIDGPHPCRKDASARGVRL